MCVCTHDRMCLWTPQHVPFFLPGVGAPVCLGGLWPGSAQICSRGLGNGCWGLVQCPSPGCEVNRLPDTPFPPWQGSGGRWGLGPTWAGKAHFKSGGQHRDKLARRPGRLSSDCCSAQRGAGTMCPPHGRPRVTLGSLCPQCLGLSRVRGFHGVSPTSGLVWGSEIRVWVTPSRCGKEDSRPGPREAESHRRLPCHHQCPCL